MAKGNGAAPPVPEDTAPGSNVSSSSFLELYDDAVDAKAEIAAAQSKYRNILKRAKDAGINLAMFKAWLTDSNKTTDQRESNIKDYLLYARWLEKPINFQATFDLAPADESPSARAAREKHAMNEVYHDGLAVGRFGSPIESDPYQPGSEESQRWRRGWLKGQAEAIAGLGEGAERPKRGRKPSAPAPANVAEAEKMLEDADA